MIAPCTDGRDGREAPDSSRSDNLDGEEARRASAITEVTVAIGAPPPDSGVILEGQDELRLDRRNSCDRNYSAENTGPARAPHLDRNATRCSRSVSELSTSIGPPRPDGPICSQRHAVVRTCSYRDDSIEYPRTTWAQDVDRQALRNRTLVAQFTRRIRTPRPNRSIGSQGEAVRGPGCHADDTRQMATTPRVKNLEWRTAIKYRAVTELSADVASPGPNSSVACQRQAMLIPSCNGCALREAHYLRWCRCRANTVEITPIPNTTVCELRNCLYLSGRHRHNLTEEPRTPPQISPEQG